MKKKHPMKKIDDLPQLKETLKQKIQLKIQSVRSSKKRTKFYTQKNIL